MGMDKTRERFLKMKAAKFYVLDQNLFWKDPRGILLHCVIEEEAEKMMMEFHEGDCGGHHYWKSTANKILRAGFY